MKFKIVSYVVIATFTIGLSGLSFSAEKPEFDLHKDCEVYTTKQAELITELLSREKEADALDALKQYHGYKNGTGELSKKNMVLLHMIDVAQKDISITKEKLRADGYSYCIGLK